MTATIPFSLSKYGIYLYTDEQGGPSSLGFAGFGIGGDQYVVLAEGEWETGIITFNQTMQYGSAFIIPYDSILQKIYAVFSTGHEIVFSEDAIIQPFVCIGIADPGAEELAYTILPATITYTGTYEGGIIYPTHTLRWGSLSDLNILLPEGSLVAILVGIMAENSEISQVGRFAISGSLLLE